jgi:hypothetical protein
METAAWLFRYIYKWNMHVTTSWYKSGLLFKQLLRKRCKLST